MIAAAAAFCDRSFVRDQRIGHVSGKRETVSKSIGALRGARPSSVSGKRNLGRQPATLPVIEAYRAADRSGKLLRNRKPEARSARVAIS